MRIWSGITFWFRASRRPHDGVGSAAVCRAQIKTRRRLQHPKGTRWIGGRNREVISDQILRPFPHSLHPPHLTTGKPHLDPVRVAGGAGEDRFDHTLGELAGSLVVLLHDADPLSGAEATAVRRHGYEFRPLAYQLPAHGTLAMT